MKKLLLLTALLVAGTFTSCKYDDDDIWDSVRGLENRVAALEELCKQLNTNISSLQTIVNALQNNDYVTGVVPVTKNGETIGYTISFTKSSPITIYHGQNGKDGTNGADGKDGANGKDGHTPVIGVRQDADGIYYWTLDGDWLLDGSGNKIKAEGRDGKDGADGNPGADGKDGQNGSDGKDGKDGANGSDGKDGQDGKDGADGITPQLKIENGYWYVSTDNGATWTNLGKATGENGKDGADGKDGANGADGIDGDSFFKSVDTSDSDYVVFTLADGTEIKLPTWYAFEQLRTLCNQMNTNINALQAIVEALQTNDYVKSVAPVMQDGKEVGYTITFSKSNPITIYHGQNGKDGANGADGKDGANGKDGHTPVIGVRQDADGVYYWTLDGDWLLDGSGNKIKAEGRNGTDGKDGADGKDGKDGKDGITPQLKIENGYWYVSTDNGATWTNLGKATGENGKDGADGKDGANGADGKDGKDGDSMFQSVTQDENNVYFTLADGTIITISKKSQSLFDRLCSIHYIPRYDDGKASVITSGENSTVEMDFEVSPKNVVSEIAASWQNILSVKAVYTATRAVIPFIDMPILSCDVDSTNGLVTITVSANDLDKDFFNGMKSASAQLLISDGSSEIVSDYVPLIISGDSGTSVPPANEIWYTTTDNKVCSPNTSGGFGAAILSHSYKNDKGIIKFDGPVTMITSTVFKSSSTIMSIQLPNTVTKIGNETFKDYTSLMSITLGNSIVSIGASAFSGCSSLINVNIPNSVTSIGASAFSGCSSLINVNIPNSVTSIGASAFSGCSSLISVNIPNGVTSIGTYAFSGCSNLTNVTIPDNVTEIKDGTFQNCSSLMSIKIPDSVTKIGRWAFLNCSNLTSATIGNSVTVIESSAFSGCSSLTSVTIGSSVTVISTNAFTNCKALSSIYCKPQIPPSVYANSNYITTSDTFYNTPTKIIYVPIGCKSAYKSAEGWKRFTTIEEIEF